MSNEQRPPGLGPHCVGQRVVVRRIVPGESGPTGGPALTDVLGVMESWGSGTTTVRAASGELHAIAVADIVSGKPVPPRPSPRQRVSPEDAERRAVEGWPPLVRRPLGEWLLRASGGFTSRANSVLAVGDPGVPFADAVSSVVGFYASHTLPPVAQVVVASDVHHRFEAAGWVHARPGEADTMFQVSSVAQALRRVRRAAPAEAHAVSLSTTAGAGWLDDDEHARSHGRTALGVLEGPEAVAFASVVLPDRSSPDHSSPDHSLPDRSSPDHSSPDRSPPDGSRGRVVAKGRIASEAGSGVGSDWAGVSNLWVSPAHRRQGLALVVLGALLEWGAERGATTAYLQTRGDNPAALALYERLGFLTHHGYRYLTPPKPGPPAARSGGRPT